MNINFYQTNNAEDVDSGNLGRTPVIEGALDQKINKPESDKKDLE